jgi:hypothetical protein
MNVTSAAGIEFADRIQRSLRLVILDQQFYCRYQAGGLEIFVIANAFKIGVPAVELMQCVCRSCANQRSGTDILRQFRGTTGCFFSLNETPLEQRLDGFAQCQVSIPLVFLLPIGNKICISTKSNNESSRKKLKDISMR